MRPKLSTTFSTRSVKYSHIPPNATRPSGLMNSCFTMRNTLTEEKLQTSSMVEARGQEHSFHPQKHNTKPTGLALCPHATLGTRGTRVGPSRTPTVHQCPEGEAVGVPNAHSTSATTKRAN